MSGYQMKVHRVSYDRDLMYRTVDGSNLVIMDRTDLGLRIGEEDPKRLLVVDGDEEVWVERVKGGEYKNRERFGEQYVVWLVDDGQEGEDW